MPGIRRSPASPPARAMTRRVGGDGGQRVDDPDAARDPAGEAQPAGAAAPAGSGCAAGAGRGTADGGPRTCSSPCRRRSGSRVLHARHERHRSSASWTSGERQPSSASDPAAISWSSLARPRVEWRSSPVARYDGHMSAWPLRRDAAPDADAALHRRAEVAAVCLEREPGRERCERRRTRPAEVHGERQRVHDDPGVEQAGPVPDRLPLPERREHRGAELASQQLAPGAAVAVLAAERAAVRDDEFRCPLHEPAEAGLATRQHRARSPPAGGCSPPRSDRTITPRSSASRSRPWSAARYAARRSGGTAASSNPGQAGEPSGSRDARPAPSSRTRHRVACARGSSMSDAARDRRLRPAAGRAVSRGRASLRRRRRRPPRAATRHRAGGARDPSSPRAARRSGSRRSAAPPPRSAGTAAAASMSSREREHQQDPVVRAARRAAASPRRPRRRCPRIPCSARATSKPRSGSSQSRP